MPLSAGDKLGPYEILAAIGKGGMGEVWRARDPQLGRDVAIKISAQQFTDRFEREARAIAALNHANVCTLYHIGPNYLVMEYIEGATLAERIKEGPIPLEEALNIAKQIADALEAAHEKSIVHRDLKPANVKIRPDGSVKVLDFGLAKAGEAQEVTSDSPTMMLGTQTGMILGTAGYMSPEQARGKQVDKRADIWAFGVVLYEMVTGKRLFEGETVTDSLAAVLTREPDWTNVPAKVQRLLRRCLEKDPKKRLRDIGDWAELLEERSAAQSTRDFSRAPWIVAGALAVLLAVVSFLHFREKPPAERVVRLSVPLPQEMTSGFLELSPDGRRLVLGGGRNATYQLFLRPLDSGELQPLSGTANARTPFWSPDGRFIAFFAENKLKVIPAAGGPTRVLCEDTGLGQGGSWNRNGLILLGVEKGLRRVGSGGGTCAAVGTEEPGITPGFPTFLPDGKHYFYLRGAPGDQGGIYVATLDDPAGHKVLADRSSVVYAPPAAAGARAHLLFLRENALMAQPFDDAGLQTVGDPFTLAQQASSSSSPPQVAASVSADGTLVYLAGMSRESQVTWFDRTGRELGKVGPRAVHQGLALSPDGNSLIVRGRYQDGTDLWLYDLARNSESPLIPRENSPGPAVWSPDSARIWFEMAGPEGTGLYQRDIRGGRQELIVKNREADAAAPKVFSDWSRDGRFAIYTEHSPKARADIWYVPVESGKPGAQAVRLLGTAADESQGQLSPDGKWLAYYSDETGKGEVYIRPFPMGPGVWKVSDDGREPRWRADGRELYFVAAAAGTGMERLMAVAVEPDGHGGLRTGAPRKLFEYRTTPVVPQNNSWSYSPHPDGQRFLANVLTATEPPTVNVILNWQSAVSGK